MNIGDTYKAGGLNNKLSDFFEYDYLDRGSMSKRARVLDNRNFQSSSEFLDALKGYNRKIGCGSKTIGNISLMEHGDYYTVVTGQQAGLLTGPLYTIFKALTAINLAKDYSASLDKPVVPVFWIATEDHDFQEIAWATLINSKSKAERMPLTGNSYKGYSVGDVPIYQRVYDLLDILKDKFPDTLHKEQIMTVLGTTLEDSSSLGEWFGRLMAWICRDYGLVFFDPMMREARNTIKPLFQQAINKWQEVNYAIDLSTNGLNALGYENQIVLTPDSVNLFYYQDKVRKALTYNNGCYETKDRFTIFDTKHELLREIEDKPEAFSPNVVLRPIAQEVLFPTLAYVAGPGEIGYYAQLKGVYKIFGLQMPIIFPRKSAILLNHRHLGIMRQYGLSEQDLPYLDDKLKEILMARGYADILSTIDEMRSYIKEAYSDLSNNPLLGNWTHPIADNGDRVLSQFNYLEKKMFECIKRDQKDLMEHFSYLINYISPRGKQQERELNIFSFINESGFDIMEMLVTALRSPQISKNPMVIWV